MVPFVVLLSITVITSYIFQTASSQNTTTGSPTSPPITLVERCQSIDIRVSADTDNWGGVYTIDTSSTATSFDAPIWRISGSTNKWLKYISTHWVLSGEDTQILIYNSTTSLSPPIDQTTSWIHESDSNVVQVTMDCSDTLAPTSSPTPAPTDVPTYSPTPDNCNILMVEDFSGNNDRSQIPFFDPWDYSKLAQHVYGRPVWEFSRGNFESVIQFLPADGWVVFVNDGLPGSGTIYANGGLFGYFPPLNTLVPFNITTNGGLPRVLRFSCFETNFPTNAPTTAPTETPSDQPTDDPTALPTDSPNSPPTDPPTFAPTNDPTVAPTVQCEALKVIVPPGLIEGNNPNCDINFTAVFDSYWLQQISRSYRPSWTLDCEDNNAQYTAACENGYSGTIFFISNQWEIQIHSKTDDCFERFIVQNTKNYFIPQNATWLDQSTNREYSFQINCTDKVFVPTPRPTGQALVQKETVKIVDQTWFPVAVILIFLILCVVCVAIWYWNKQKKDTENSEQPQSGQALELAEPPQPAFVGNVDPEVAPYAVDAVEDEGDGDEDDLKIDQANVDEADGQSPTQLARIGSTLADPNMNPNLKKNVSVVSAASVSYAGAAGATAGGASPGSRMEGDEYKSDEADAELENEEEEDANSHAQMDQLEVVNAGESGDKALDMIAGKKSVTGYEKVSVQDSQDEDTANSLDDIGDEHYNI